MSGQPTPTADSSRHRSEFPSDQYSPTWPDRIDTGRGLVVKTYHAEGIRC
jgi:hypothetical protein